ncbi:MULTISPECIES: hypothetical protein [unclassified Pseudoclavibacter]|uniref:hypothetical protein n=1 Tax=unclassified Pseudoclavibacter TaxID=2615177 RepID=UPI001BAB1053|nr:hypothetical protein [Pseudoclavibacter sp. Marseille-Q4354]MBS3177736.1 hypothetical protein [Pseudoclavibacter sp. Marseille-Q4354]
MAETFEMPRAQSLAEAIRDAVRVGAMGPNSSFLLARGHPVALTPQEAEDASKRLTPWLMSFVDTLVAQREAEVLEAARVRAEGEVESALAAVRGEPVSWTVLLDDPPAVNPVPIGSLMVAHLEEGGELVPVRVLWSPSSRGGR